MTTLSDLQHAFQRHVISGDTAIASQIEQGRRVPAQERLDVYAHAYRIRLRDALASTYPHLQKALGAAEFDTIAWRYIDERPSRFASIRWFGDRLSASLRESHPTQPWLAELAAWEWALAAVFDAADAAPLTMDALAALAPDEWPSLRFGFHPSLHRLQLLADAAALYRAFAEDVPAIEPTLLNQPQPWLLWRQDMKPCYRSLEPAEAAALDVLIAGGTFADLCESLCSWHEPDEVPVRAASLLKGWLSEGLIVSLDTDR